MKKHLIFCSAILLSTIGAFCQTPEKKFEEIRSRAESEENRDLELFKAFRSGEINDQELGHLRELTLKFDKNFHAFCKDGFSFNIYCVNAKSCCEEDNNLDNFRDFGVFCQSQNFQNSGMQALVRFMKECKGLEILNFDFPQDNGGVIPVLTYNMILGPHTEVIKGLTNLKTVTIKADKYAILSGECYKILVNLPDCVKRLNFLPATGLPVYQQHNIEILPNGDFSKKYYFVP